MDPPELVEGRDYYVGPGGLYVFTAAYLSARGYCCRSGCRHCPYGFNSEVEAVQDAKGDEADEPPCDPSPPPSDGVA